MSEDEAKVGVGRAEAEAEAEVAVWADGCYDFFHWGHANSLRQSKAFGQRLVVGVHSDADITRHKGPPVMNEEERYAAVRACRWADEVVEAAPYVTQMDVMDEHGCDLCTHGEDITTDEDGRDCYHAVKEAGRFRVIQRTQGVSTTQLLGRMLLMTKEHLKRGESGDDSDSSSTASAGRRGVIAAISSNLLPSSRMLAAFAAECRPPSPDDKIVYVDGAFDLFNVAHIDALKQAKAMGTYLIVGLHDDPTVNGTKGLNFPIQTLHERVLSVLQCRYVDDVITGAPWNVTEEVINTLNISIVASGTVCDYPDDEYADPYAVAKRMGIYRQFESAYPDLTTRSLIRRVIRNRDKFEERNSRKSRGEAKIKEQLRETREQHERALKAKEAEKAAEFVAKHVDG